MVKLYSIIFDAQLQLTLKLVVGCDPKSKSVKLLWCFLLPAKIRKIHLKIKGIEWSQVISHCICWQIFSDPQGQLTPQSTGN